MRPQQQRLIWPLTASQVESLDSMLETLFRAVRTTDQTVSALAAAPTETSIIQTLLTQSSEDSGDSWAIANAVAHSDVAKLGSQNFFPREQGIGGVPVAGVGLTVSAVDFGHLRLLSTGAASHVGFEMISDVAGGGFQIFHAGGGATSLTDFYEGGSRKMQLGSSTFSVSITANPSVSVNSVGTSILSGGAAGNVVQAQIFGATSAGQTAHLLDFIPDASSPSTIPTYIRADGRITCPVIYGGAGTTSTLTFAPTSGAGTTGSDIFFKAGNDGAVEGMRVNDLGQVSIGGVTPTALYKLTVQNTGNNARAVYLTNPTASGDSAIEYSINANDSTVLFKAYSSTYGTAALAGWVLMAQTAGTGGLFFDTETAAPIKFATNGFTNERMRIDSAGHVGIGLTTVTAMLHLKAGTTAANTAPLKFTSGTSLTTAEAGAIEFTTDDYYATITTGAARKGIVLNNGSNLVSGKVPFATTNGRLSDTAAIAVTLQPGPASGTDTAGSDLTIASGAGTGNATPSKIVMQVPITGTTGTTPESMVGKLYITNKLYSMPDNTDVDLFSVDLPTNDTSAALHCIFTYHVTDGAGQTGTHSGIIIFTFVNQGGTVTGSSTDSGESFVGTGAGAGVDSWTVNVSGTTATARAKFNNTLTQTGTLTFIILNSSAMNLTLL